MPDRPHPHPASADRALPATAALPSALVLTVCILATPSLAGLHEKGQLSTSISGSFSFTQNYDRKSELTVEYTGDGLLDTGETEGDDYADIDTSVALSVGYFPIDHFELGLTGSAMGTWYTGTDLEDFEIYDLQVYGKYFFDNRSNLTPYLKLSGGPYWLRTGSYEEDDWSAALAVGLEFYSFGPISCYGEVSTEYTELDGSISGTEWETRVYLGVSFYSNILNRKAAEPPPAAAPGATAVEDDSRWERDLRRFDERVTSGIESE